MAKLLSNRLIQELDGNGAPYAGAKLFTYAAGTSTKTATYQDEASSTAHANPIVLDANGRIPAGVWLTSGQEYKLILAPSTDTDPPVSPIWSLDGVSGINDLTVGGLDQWSASGLTPTFISASSFSVPGDVTSTFHVGRRLKITDAGGTKYATITVTAFITVTTVTVSVDASGSLVSPTSVVSYGVDTADNPSQPLLTDAFPIVSGSADKTKKVRLEVDGLTTATTRVLTVPDADITIVGTATTQTLTNKTVNLANNTLTGTVAEFDVAISNGALGLVKLNEGAVSNAATLDIVMTAYTAYRNKRLVYNLIPATDGAELNFRVSTDGGTNYDAAAGNYSYFFSNANSSTGEGIAGNSNSATHIKIAINGIGNAATDGIGGYVEMFDTINTARWPQFTFSSSFVSSDVTPVSVYCAGQGTRRDAKDTDAIRLLFDSGNIASGTWTLYGYN